MRALMRCGTFLSAELSTLFLQMLFDYDFKVSFTRGFVAEYRHFMATVVRLPERRDVPTRMVDVSVQVTVRAPPVSRRFDRRRSDKGRPAFGQWSNRGRTAFGGRLGHVAVPAQPTRPDAPPTRFPWRRSPGIAVSAATAPATAAPAVSGRLLSP